MTTKTVVLTDVAGNIWRNSCSLSAGDGPALIGSDKWSLSKRTLRGGLSDGVDVVEVNNGALSVAVLPTRGMGLWRGEFRGIPLGWKSPVALPVNPCFVNLEERGGLGWLSGFNELLCRCGLAFNGPPGTDVVVDDDGNRSESPLTLHGRIANTPAHYVEVAVADDGPGTLTVAGIVDESSMFGSRLQLKSTLSTQAGSNRLKIVDEITNRAGNPAELELLYHINLGRPFLEPNAKFAAAVREVASRDQRAAEGIGDWQIYGPPQAGFAEQVYFVVPSADANGETVALLCNAAADCGLSLRFNVDQLPCFSLWKNTQAEADGYVTGLEPATNFPNLKTFEREQRRVVTLAPGDSYTTALEIAVHKTAAEVGEVVSQIETLQREVEPVIHATPQPLFSPVDRRISLF